MVSVDSSVDLDSAIAVTRSDANIGTPVRPNLAAGMYAASVLLDETSVVSELWLSGEPGSVIRLPSPSSPGRQLTAEGEPSAPLAALVLRANFAVHLEGLTFEGGADSVGVSAVIVEAGQLTMHNCTLRNVQGARALRVDGGIATVTESRFVANAAGAIAATANTTLVVERTILVGNEADKGGALFVEGARTMVTVATTRLERNTASTAGGAVHVAAGSVMLSNGTLLVDNSAPEGSALHLLGGTTLYALPAPAGLWVNTALRCGDGGGVTDGCDLSRRPTLHGRLVHRLADGAHDGSYPLACPPGVFGTAEDIAQVSPTCAGACPAGRTCAAGTHTPLPCQEGTYCPQGSAAGTLCPPGTTGFGTNLTSVDECATCPLGHFCLGGAATRCPRSTYNPLAGQSTQLACVPCASNSLTVDEAATSDEACLCATSFYSVQQGEGTLECAICPVGSDCASEGTTLATLPLQVGYYRTSNASDDLRRCPDFGNSSGCIGGIGSGEGPCKASLRGPYCTLCVVTSASHFYDAETSTCLPCENEEVTPSLIAAAVVVVVIGALAWERLEPHRNVPSLKRAVSRLSRLASMLSLRAKGKQLLGFYQVATRISSVYEVPMPEAVSELLSFFELFNINIDGIGLPLQCYDLRTYAQQLAAAMLLPVVIAALLVLGFVTRSFCRGAVTETTRLDAGLLDALPWLLSLSFLVLPMVSSAAFRAFSCETFDDSRSFLRADYSIECGTDTHANAERLAWLAIILYPVGISVLYMVLMWSARHAIRSDKPTALSKSLGFLCRDYEPTYLWWELLEAWKKLFLVGFAVLIRPGSIEQLVSAFCFTLILGLLVGIAMPFKDDSDDYFAKACSFSLTALFFFSVVLKFGMLTQEVDDVLTARLRSRFVLDTGLATIGMAISIVCALVLAAVMAVLQLVAAAPCRW